MSQDEDTSLKTLLALRTQDQAHIIVRQHERDTGLEQYRALAAHFEADTEAWNLEDLRTPIQPPTATSMDDFAKKFPAWNSAHQRNVNRTGPSAVLSDAVRRTIWICMLPPKEREDVNRNRHLLGDGGRVVETLVSAHP